MQTATHFQDFTTIHYTENEKKKYNGNTPIPIKIADLDEKKIYYLSSMQDAQRIFDISPRSIGLRFQGKVQNTPIFGRYLPALRDQEFDTSCLIAQSFKLKDPSTKKHGRYTACKVKDLQTEEIYTFNSMKEAAKFIGISSPMIGDVINGWIKNPIIKGQYLVALLKEEFMALPKDPSVFRSHISARKKISKIIVEKDGVRREFSSVVRFARFLEVGKDLLYYHIKRGSSNVKVLKGWTVISPTRSFFGTVASPFVKHVKRKERFELHQSE